MQPGVRTRALSENTSSKVVAVRGSNVLHTSELPVVSAHHAREKLRRTGKRAAALTAKQKRWRVLMGIAPLNANERTRASLAYLRKKVSAFPVNGPQECITLTSMAPYFIRANTLRHQFDTLGAQEECCESDEEFEEADVESSAESQEGEEHVIMQARVRKAPEKYES